MAFKYQKELDRIKQMTNMDCVSKDLVPYQKDVFRWTFNCIYDERNFAPRALLVEGREDNCSSWALSMFDTLENGRKRLLELCADKPNLFKKLGTHIAYGPLETSDGVGEHPASNGHFNFFEFEGCNLSNKFVIVEAVA